MPTCQPGFFCLWGGVTKNVNYISRLHSRCTLHPMQLLLLIILIELPPSLSPKCQNFFVILLRSTPADSWQFFFKPQHVTPSNAVLSVKEDLWLCLKLDVKKITFKLQTIDISWPKANKFGLCFCLGRHYPPYPQTKEAFRLINRRNRPSSHVNPVNKHHILCWQ